MHYLHAYPEVIKISNFRRENVDISGAQGVVHAINKFFGFSVVKA